MVVILTTHEESKNRIRRLLFDDIWVAFVLFLILSSLDLLLTLIGLQLGLTELNPLFQKSKFIDLFLTALAIKMVGAIALLVSYKFIYQDNYYNWFLKLLYGLDAIYGIVVLNNLFWLVSIWL